MPSFRAISSRSSAFGSTHSLEDSLPLPSRAIKAKLLVDGAHYEELVTRAVARATVSVWIGTANLKTMLVEAPIGTRARARGRYISFFEVLSDLARRGVDVCILHASAPSRPLEQEIARLNGEGRSRNRTRIEKQNAVKLRRCPRVHLKMIAIDGQLLYLGSANLTGAGLGAKGDGRRNFEMGIVTDDVAMLDATQERFDRIWRGAECKSCKLRSVCDAPLDVVPSTRLSTTSTKSATSTTRVTSRASSPRARRSPSSPP